MRPVTLSRSLAAAVATAVCAAQTTAGAGALTLNGTLATGGVATLPVQQQLAIASTGNLSAINFTISGTDQQGRAVSEVVAGPNNNTVNSVLNYLTVTSITVSATVGTNVTVGTGQLGASQEIPVDQYLDPGNISVFVEVVGTINYTVQWTGDDVFANAPGPFTWFDSAANLTGATSSQAGSIVAPVSAIRLLTNSGSGKATITVRQAGLTS